MSTYLICSTPAHGHVVPLLGVARHLVGQGHRVRFLTSERYGDRVRASGSEFLPLPPGADVNLDDATGQFPARADLRGPAALRFDILNLFLRPAREQYEALRGAMEEVAVDAVLTEQLFIGAALLRERSRAERPPIVVLGIFPLGVRSRDAAPFGLGITPMSGALGRIRNTVLSFVADRLIFGSVHAQARAMSRQVVGSPLARDIFDWASGAEAIVQFTVAGFEYPRSDLPANVHFVGPLPPAASDAPVPEWWADIDGTRPVVHVTQGTVANDDFGQLIEPAISGLAASETLVVVSTGGRPLSDLSGPIPANVRVSEYLPYDRLLPLVDVVVTNGGYGGVQQALGHGVPLVVAGQTEDKVEVSARVGWAGVGVNLRTNHPSATHVARAVGSVLTDSSFRHRARAIAAEISSAPGLAGLDAVLAHVASKVPAAGDQR
ncbi:glycosyltransferase [Planococcus sp. APC 4015]|nr:glycosyltransferase [Planococcus sp. APC 4015]